MSNLLFINSGFPFNIVIDEGVNSIGDYAFAQCVALEKVYYKGTAEEWATIIIDSGNSYLTNATRYYYSETQPTAEGYYWHYDENGEAVAW